MDTSALGIDSTIMDIEKQSISDQSWFYENVEETLPINIRSPRDQGVNINMFCEAAHVTDLITRCSTTGIISLLFNTAIMWYAK